MELPLSIYAFRMIGLTVLVQGYCKVLSGLSGYLIDGK